MANLNVTDNLTVNGYDAVTKVSGAQSTSQYSFRTNNGFIIKGGSYSGTSIPTITFDEAFPNACVFAWITKTATKNGSYYVGINTYSTTGFSAGDFADGIKNKTGVWIALGY